MKLSPLKANNKQMKKIAALFAITLLIFTGCKKEDNAEIDTEYPEILTTANSFPLQCGVLTRGQTANH